MYLLVIPCENTCLMVNVREVLNEEGPLGCEVEQDEQGLVLKGDFETLLGIKKKVSDRLEIGCRDAHKEGKWNNVGYLIAGRSSLSRIDILPEQ